MIARLGCRPRSPAWLLAAAALLLTGCAARRPQAAPARTGAHYELRPLGRESILIPPGAVTRLDATEILLRLPVKGKGRHRRAPACQIRTGHFELRWEGSMAAVRAVPAWLGVSGAEGRIPVALASDLEAFRARLGGLEASGCLAPGGGPGLVQQIIERLPLPSTLAYYLRYGAYMSTGYIDADPRFALKVVRPARNDGGEVDGFRTAYFRLEPVRGALRPVPSSLEEARRDGTRRQLPPVPEPLLKPLEAAGHLRLFFLTRASSADHDIALVGAPDAASMERITPGFLARPGPFCHAPPAGLACVLAPRGVAVSLELSAQANGKLVRVPLGGTVREILRAAGAQPEKALSSLRVWRPFGGRLVPITWQPGGRDVLSLVLIGGEDIRW